MGEGLLEEQPEVEGGVLREGQPEVEGGEVSGFPAAPASAAAAVEPLRVL